MNLNKMSLNIIQSIYSRVKSQMSNFIFICCLYSSETV